jgi:hypothetical protein
MELKNDTTGNQISNAKEAGYCFLCISGKGWKGQGSSPNKICVAAKNRCWIWFQEVEYFKGISLRCHNLAIAKYDGEKITLNFKYENNDDTKLQELFNLRNNIFDVEEDIIEGKDSPLLDLCKTSLSCQIPAGSYPITIDSEGIIIILPVIIK